MTEPHTDAEPLRDTTSHRLQGLPSVVSQQMVQGVAVPQQVPQGTVTLLFTDIESSTQLLHRLGDGYAAVLEQHRDLLREAFISHSGHEVDTQGDAFLVAFQRAGDAVAGAVAAQRALHLHPWPAGAPLRVRMGLHTGEPQRTPSGYVGVDVHRGARVMAAGHGGQVLLSQTVYVLTQEHLPAGVSLRDLGEHRLKDLNRPEHLYQLVISGLPADFPPLKTLSNQPNNLPLQMTSFVGREQEMDGVKTRLTKTRLLSLTGTGGTGKTRLSLQVAAEVLEEYPDGVWLVELAPLADPALLPQAVAGVLGVREGAGELLAKTLLAALKDKQMLLVLDNCEHLLEAVARLVDAMLHTCPRIKVLVSSREALGIAGESTYRVPSLSLPNLQQPYTPDSLSQYEAVRLFIERAVAAKAEFAVTNHNAPALASVCHRLDGIPLALELAAARIRSMTVEELEKRLSDRFRVLTGGNRTALPRQQTLRALIDWSYDLLDQSQKELLARLAVFAGGWTLDAAESVCVGGDVEEWQVLELLTALVDKNLVLAEEQAGTTRYRLLETVRQYARERLASDEVGEAYRLQHRDYFLRLVETGVAHLHGPQQAHWFNVMETEHDNLRQALTLCLEQAEEQDPTEGQHPTEWGEATEKGLRLGGALQQFWWPRGYVSEGRERLTALLSLPRAQQCTQARVQALIGAGNLARLQSDYATAGSLLEEALTINRELGDKQGIAASLVNLGQVAIDKGDVTLARSLYEEALTLNKEVGDKRGIKTCLSNLGIVFAEQGDFASARSLLEEALAISRELGDKHSVAISLCNLGFMAAKQDDLVQARAIWEECLRIDQELGIKGGSVWGNLADLAWKEGRLQEAQSLWHTSLHEQEEMGKRAGVAKCLEGLSDVALAGEPPWPNAARGIRLLSAAAAIREAVGLSLPPRDQQQYEEHISGIRQAVGDEAFNAAWAQGQAMSWQRAVKYALSDTP